MGALVQGERKRLMGDISGEEQPRAFFRVRFLAACPAMAPQDVLERARCVLRVVNEADKDDWPTIDEWTSHLPEWFVSACAPVMTREQTEERIDRMRTLPHEEWSRMQGELWTLENWLYWMIPNNRYWWWWYASVHGPDNAVVDVIAYETPFPWDSLRWLYRAAGASDLVEAED